MTMERETTVRQPKNPPASSCLRMCALVPMLFVWLFFSVAGSCGWPDDKAAAPTDPDGLFALRTDWGDTDLAYIVDSLDRAEPLKEDPSLEQAYLEARMCLDFPVPHPSPELLPEAIDLLSSVIAVFPDFAPAYMNRGIAYTRTGDLETAMADFASAIELRPGYGLAYVNRAITRVKGGDLDEALADMDRAVAIEPHFARLYRNRAVVHVLMAQRDMEEYTTLAY